MKLDEALREYAKCTRRKLEEDAGERCTKCSIGKVCHLLAQAQHLLKGE